MADKHMDKDSEAAASRDFEPAPDYESRGVVGYGADRKPAGTYFAWLIGAAVVLGLVLFATGFFGGYSRDQANNPSIEKLQTTTGQAAK